MRTTAEILHALPYFSDLPEEILSSVCDGSDQVELDQGTVIIEEGTHSEEMYIVVEGQLKVTKHTPEKEVELARLGPGEVVGEIALLDQAPRTATVTTAEPSLLIKVPVDAFEELLRDPRVVRRMFRTVTARLRDIEDTLRHEERMAALGRMAAQLMHELNNPAAAVARSTEEARKVYEQLGDEAAFLMAGTLAETGIVLSPPGKLSALDRGDLEDSVGFWLEEHGLSDAWELSPGLVEAGWTPELLDKATTGMSEELTPHFVRWTALRATAEQVIGEIAIGARRISELVRVVKEYSYLDQAPVQEVDVREGISDTLILLKGKLRDIDVITEFDEDLVKVDAPGRDLNQVWTNLIDNACDAMDGEGELRISAHNDGTDIVVGVSDNGSGMPPEVAERIFDPFYTTKEPGKGTGLGLHTVHSIIGRIGGEITVDSELSGTTFTVRIPALQGPSQGS